MDIQAIADQLLVPFYQLIQLVHSYRLYDLDQHLNDLFPVLFQVFLPGQIFSGLR